GLDDRRDDSGDRDRLAAGVPRHPRAVSVRHRRRDGRPDGPRAAATEQFLRARVDHRPGLPRGRRRAGARRQLDGRGHRPAGRVGCYYHDIGKIKNPQYFVENQTRGNNPHDRLKAHQSAQIIKAHVTDGLALAREARLPEAVAAFIPEHHGTTEITYFLDRAKKSGDGGSPRPGDYVYPGPKPHSSETAITMLADSVEAALRVLEDLTPQKIEEVIDHIVRTKLN